MDRDVARKAVYEKIFTPKTDYTFAIICVMFMVVVLYFDRQASRERMSHSMPYYNKRNDSNLLVPQRQEGFNPMMLSPY